MKNESPLFVDEKKKFEGEKEGEKISRDITKGTLVCLVHLYHLR